jgi:hypothetical protein
VTKIVDLSDRTTSIRVEMRRHISSAVDSSQLGAVLFCRILHGTKRVYDAPLVSPIQLLSLPSCLGERIQDRTLVFEISFLPRASVVEYYDLVVRKPFAKVSHSMIRGLDEVASIPIMCRIINGNSANDNEACLRTRNRPPSFAKSLRRNLLPSRRLLENQGFMVDPRPACMLLPSLRHCQVHQRTYETGKIHRYCSDFFSSNAPIPIKSTQSLAPSRGMNANRQ